MHDEEVLGKVYDGRLMRRLLAYLAPYKLVVAVSLVLVLLVSALKLVGPILTKVAIDDYIAAGDLGGLNVIALVYVLALVAQFVISYFQIYIMNMAGQRVMADMRREIFSHLQRLHPSFFDKNPVGRLVTRVTTDVDALNELFTSGVVTIFGDVFMLAGIMGVLIYLDWRLALVTFAVLPALFTVTIIFKRRVRVVYRKVRTRIAMLNAFIQEHIVGMTVVQLFRQEDRKFEEYSELNRLHTEANIESILHYSIFYPVVEALSAVAIALIVWYGGGQILLGALTLGGLVAFIQYSEKFFRPISDLSEKFNILQGAMASSERIFGLLDTENEIRTPDEPLTPEHRDGSVCFENVSFAYEGDDWVLRDVDLDVRAGEMVAVVGHTGAGKSTLMSLLMRFYDVRHGRVLVEGVDVRDWKLEDLRRQFGMVLQDVHLFSGTIASNIRLGDDSISDEAVAAAAAAVNLDEWVATLPNGLQEEVKERGSSLSAGQKQLVSFARALVHDPKILILDEATSNVDTHTELLVREALERLLANRTSIVIAHRLSTIQKADRIVVLHKGRVREVGTHQELLAERGIYYKLYQLQYKDQEFEAQAS
ncbi:MAG: ABC transporter ATP-binding protein [Acidobacteriota bacterium]|nr:MAG: ABC transporter ATP-binding protein [Acidobacteriota bacterium]